MNNELLENAKMLFCDSEKKQVEKTRSEKLKEKILSDEMYKPFLFIHILKTAGMSIVRTKLVNREGGPIGIHMGHTRAIDIDEDFLLKFCSFSVARNPYSRLVSIFRFYTSWTDHNKSRRYQLFRRDLLPAGINFTKFCEKIWIPRKRLPIEDILRDSQFSWIANSSGEIIIDHMLRFENIDNDWRNLQISNNVPHKYITTLEKINVSRPLLNSVKKRSWQEFYDKNLAEKIYDYYREDFDKFGYEKDSYLKDFKK